MIAQLTDDGKNFVWLIPVLRNGRPWKFIRRPDGDTRQINITGDEAPRVVLFNGRPLAVKAVN